VTVDGGTNKWLHWLKQHNLEHKLKHPNLITGDFDSVYAKSLDFFSESNVIKTPNQEYTDFTKCLQIVLENHAKELKLTYIIALCETSGRFDQIIANINTLFIHEQKFDIPVYILSANNLTWLLSFGQHVIHIPQSVKKLWCSLIPIGSPCNISTTGLKWNLKNQKMQFGDIVSTSNAYDELSNVVDITIDSNILWSMGISKIDDE
jgi:thiamine pyrophosphokinase